MKVVSNVMDSVKPRRGSTPSWRPGRTTFQERVRPMKIKTELVVPDKRDGDPLRYLHELSLRRAKPVLLVERRPLQGAMEKLGAKGLSVADVLEPYQLQYPLYIGVTTAQAT